MKNNSTVEDEASAWATRKIEDGTILEDDQFKAVETQAFCEHNIDLKFQLPDQWTEFVDALTRRHSHLRVMDLDQTFSGDSGQLENMPCYVRLCEYALEALDKNNKNEHIERNK